MERLKSTVNKLISSFTVKLKQSYNTLGVSDELSRYVDEEMQKAINDVTDKELVRVRPQSDRGLTIEPLFLRDGVFNNDYNFAGFSKGSIQAFSQALVNSVYIFELFDSPSSSTQSKLSFNFTKADVVGTYSDTTDSNGHVTVKKAQLSFGVDNRVPEFNMLYIPSHLMGGDVPFRVYMRVSFFNGLTGKRAHFETLSSVGEQKGYLAIVVDPVSKNYYFEGVGSRVQLKQYIKGVEGTKGGAEEEGVGTITNKRGTLSEVLTGVLESDIYDEIGNGGGYQGLLTEITIHEQTWYDAKSYRIDWKGIDNARNLSIIAVMMDTGRERVIGSVVPCSGSFIVTSFSTYWGFGDTDDAIKPIKIRLQMLDDPNDYVESDPFNVSSKQYPPIVWGNPTVSSADWYLGNVYDVNYNSPQPKEGVDDFQGNRPVHAMLEYVCADGNLVQQVISPPLLISMDENPTGYTKLWVSKYLIFNSVVESGGYSSIKLKLRDGHYPTNTFQVAVIKFFQKTNASSTAYLPKPDGSVPTIEPLGFQTLHKPVKDRTVYEGQPILFSWEPKFPSNRQVIIGFVYYNPVYRVYDWYTEFWPANADLTTIFQSTNYYKFEGSQSKAYAFVRDGSVPYMFGSNMLIAPVTLSRLAPPIEPQPNLKLVRVTIGNNVTTFTNKANYTVNWSEADSGVETFVRVVLRYLNHQGQIVEREITRMSPNNGTIVYNYNVEMLTFDAQTSAVVRVEDAYYPAYYVDSPTITLTIPARFYYDKGYQEGYYEYQDGASQTPEPPQHLTETQVSEYKDGYNRGWTDKMRAR